MTNNLSSYLTPNKKLTKKFIKFVFPSPFLPTNIKVIALYISVNSISGYSYILTPFLLMKYSPFFIRSLNVIDFGFTFTSFNLIN